jgi:hypothetical protein
MFVRESSVRLRKIPADVQRVQVWVPGTWRAVRTEDCENQGAGWRESGCGGDEPMGELEVLDGIGGRN